MPHRSFNKDKNSVPSIQSGHSFHYTSAEEATETGVTKNRGKMQITRTAMGEYIVPPGAKPLTSLCDSSPGPADYTPSIVLTKQCSPQYSIVGKFKPKLEGNGIPGPSDYSTAGTLIWKKKSTLKDRNRKSHFDEEAERSCTVIGPAKYNVKDQNFGASGPKYTIARKQKPEIYTGPPNGVVQPVDTHGFKTPGPNYRPNSSYWKRGPEKSFGSARQDTYADGPGPSDYDVKGQIGGPSYSFGVKLPPPPSLQTSINRDSPGPNTYNLGTTIGKARAVIVSSRWKEVKAGVFQSPSPATYFLRNSIQHSRKPITLAYRWFDINEPKAPGPSDYNLTDSNLRKSPCYSNRVKSKPSFPESLHYVPKDSGECPGPGDYNLSKEFVKNDGPAFSLSKKARQTISDNPAPNAYHAEQQGNPGSRKAPSFSMGKRFEVPDSKISPGPAAYDPKMDNSGAPKFTMTGRVTRKKVEKNPAPNAYVPRSTFAQANVSLKSRASPYVYSGFPSNKFLEQDGQAGKLPLVPECRA